MGNAARAIATTINELISEHGTTEFALANRTGIAKTTLNRKLRGGASLTVQEVQDIADALGVSVVEMFVRAGV